MFTLLHLPIINSSLADKGGESVGEWVDGALNEVGGQLPKILCFAQLSVCVR